MMIGYHPNDCGCPECDRLNAETAPTLAPIFIERVAEALYERAMSERRTFSREPQKFTKRWSDEPFVPIFDGDPRPTNWRDDWRDEARRILAGSRTSEDR